MHWKFVAWCAGWRMVGVGGRAGIIAAVIQGSCIPFRAAAASGCSCRLAPPGPQAAAAAASSSLFSPPILCQLPCEICSSTISLQDSECLPCLACLSLATTRQPSGQRTQRPPGYARYGATGDRDIGYSRRKTVEGSLVLSTRRHSASTLSAQRHRCSMRCRAFASCGGRETRDT
jgi:hypothetical protein